MKYGRVTAELKNLPEDEPVFILRAKDALAPIAVELYASLLEAAHAGYIAGDNGMDGNALERMSIDVRNAAAQMTVWQAEHIDQVRLPD
jgi:hypothetical protein